jgi:hypothetical protein
MLGEKKWLIGAYLPITKTSCVHRLTGKKWTHNQKKSSVPVSVPEFTLTNTLVSLRLFFICTYKWCYNFFIIIDMIELYQVNGKQIYT